MFHSFSAAEPFGEKEEKSIKSATCILYLCSFFLFLEAFSNFGGEKLQEGFVGLYSHSSVSLPYQ